MIRPQKPGEYSFKVKRSEFIGLVFPLVSREGFQEKLKSIRKTHYSASHVCWGYRILSGHSIQENSSDAGEPSGSAGLPILNQLKRKDVMDCALFVIRYYGGIKLGKRGLIAAYGECALGALSATTFETIVQKELIKIESELKFYGEIVQLLGKFNGKILKDDSTDRLRMDIEIRADDTSSFYRELKPFT